MALSCVKDFSIFRVYSMLSCLYVFWKFLCCKFYWLHHVNVSGSWILRNSHLYQFYYNFYLLCQIVYWIKLILTSIIINSTLKHFPNIYIKLKHYTLIVGTSCLDKTTIEMLITWNMYKNWIEKSIIEQKSILKYLNSMYNNLKGLWRYYVYKFLLNFYKYFSSFSS